MSRSLQLATGILLAAAAGAAADTAPPAWTRHITVVLEVEAAEPFPDYLFFWPSYTSHVEPFSDSRSTIPGSRRTFEIVGGRTVTGVHKSRVSVVEFEPAPGRPVRIPSGLYGGPHLYAVPRAEADRYPTREALAQAVVEDKVSAVAQEYPGASGDKSPVDRPTTITVRYRVERSPTGNGLVFVRLNGRGDMSETSGGLGGLTEESLIRWAVAGVAAAVGVAGFGLWLDRRRRPNTAGLSRPPVPGPELGSGR